MDREGRRLTDFERLLLRSPTSRIFTHNEASATKDTADEHNNKNIPNARFLTQVCQNMCTFFGTKAPKYVRAFVKPPQKAPTKEQITM